jgi:hypothetical protein
MINWDDEMSWWDNESRSIRRIFLSKRNLFDQMIWSSDLINWILFHCIIIQFFMHERFDHESHLLFETIRIVKFFINMLISNSVVLRLFSRDDLFKSKWFFSYLLIFEIVERSMSTKMSMRFWWNQIEVTMKLEDSLIRRKNLVTIEDLDSQKNLDESRNERSVNKIVKKEFLYHELFFSSRLNRQQLAFHSFVSQ